MPRKAAIYLHTLFNGGIERVIFDLATEMIARQIAVDLVVNTLDFSPVLQELPKDVNLINLRCTGFASRLPRLIGYLRTRKPNCLLSAGHCANEVAILAKVLSMSKIRVVVSEQTNLSSELNALPPANVRRLAIPPIGRMIYPLADGVVAVSDAVRSDIERLFRLKPGICQTIPNAVNVERILRLGQEQVDHPWFQADGHPVVLGLGRLEEQKDFTTLLDAFAKLRKQLNARLVILGEGSHRQRLKTRIVQLGLNDCVWLGEFAANPYPYIKRASILTLSSKWEGLPVVLIEALVLGVPIVSTDCAGGSREILAGGEYGALVPVGNPAAMADAMFKALCGDRPRNIPDKALAKYRINAVADEYLKLLAG